MIEPETGTPRDEVPMLIARPAGPTVGFRSCVARIGRIGGRDTIGRRASRSAQQTFPADHNPKEWSSFCFTTWTETVCEHWSITQLSNNYVNNADIGAQPSVICRLGGSHLNTFDLLLQTTLLS